VVCRGASGLDFRNFDFRSVGPIGLIRLDLFHSPGAFFWVRFFGSHCPGRVVGWAISRFDFGKADFSFVGAIDCIPIDLLHFPISLFWVRFFNLVARTAWSARVPRDSICASLISASLALSISFRSTYLIYR